MTQTLQTGYRSTLGAKLNASDITCTVATAPTVTAGRMHVYSGSTHAWIKYTGLSGTTLTGVTFVSQTADPATTVTGTTFPAGTAIELVEMHDQMLDKQQGGIVAGAMTFSDDITVIGDTVTGASFKNPVYADDTARDAGIPSPANGMVIYNTALGIHQQYIAGAWTSFASGTTVNADTITAGKVEISTAAEILSETDTGGSGATLAVTPSQINRKPTVNSGSDGTDGALSISSGTTTLAANTAGYVEKFYSSISISGSALLNFSGKTSNGLVAILHCSGDFTMSGGTIDADGQGGEGGTGWGGAGSAGKGYIYSLLSNTTPSQTGGVGLSLPISDNIFRFCGSGGYGGSVGSTGGAGGGIVIIRVSGAINFTGGTIKASGTNGTIVNGGGGGGGGGGSVVIFYNKLTANSGTITVNGGNGANGLNSGTSSTGHGGGGGFSSGGNGGSSSGAGSNGTSNSYGSGGTGGAAGTTSGGGGGGGAGFKYVGRFLV